MYRLAALLAALMLVAALPCFAEDLDLSTIKCKDFLTAGNERIATVITWLDGYYKDKDDPPVIGFDKFAANSEKLKKYCSDNPDNGLITAADQVLAK